MISDVLHDAVVEIDRYLTEPTFNDTYSGSIGQRIINVRNLMDELRAELDQPPFAAEKGR